MSRLVAVSNRISDATQGRRAGRLAVGVLAAMQARGGLWFGWSGDVVDETPGDRAAPCRAGITFATTDLRVRTTAALPRLLQRHAVAALSLLRRQVPVRR